MTTDLPGMDPWWIWCLFLVVGFGACLGSFANVIIFRMPQGIPLGDPRWSFCPHCGARIGWLQNIPVLSFFLLRGRCSACRGAIAQRYVIVEVLMILVFVLLFDALFVGSRIDGVISGTHWSVAYRFYSDWTLMSACCILFACLLVLSAIDMEVYWVDIRFTHFAAACGFVLHALWTPSPGWPRPGPRFGMAALAASAAAVATHLLLGWYWRRQAAVVEVPSAGLPHADDPVSSPASQDLAVGGDDLQTSPATGGQLAVRIPWSAMLAVAVLLFTLTALAWALIDSGGAVPHPAGRDFWWRVGPGLAFVFLVLVAGSAVHRESDREIAECLDAERGSARLVALQELLLVLPTLAVFILVLILGGKLLPAWDWQVLHTIQPVAGLGRAAAGFFVASALGWGVRIVFTLVLGKEAFGTGDIHLMGAAGAVLGWEVVVVGFFLSSVLALAGKVLTLPFKSSRVLPMGPWLSLGIFLVTLVQSGVQARIIDPVRQVVDMVMSTPP